MSAILSIILDFVLDILTAAWFWIAIAGIVASGDQFINNASRKTFIRDTFGAVCCEMEGAAIGQVCYVGGVDFVIIRCISDNASGEAEMEYPEMVKIAAVRSQKLVEAIVKEI